MTIVVERSDAESSTDVKADPEWRGKIACAKRVRAERLQAHVGRPIQFRTGWPR